MRVIVLSAAFAALCLPARPVDVDPAEIIQKFAAKELEFKEARNNYTYRQSVKLEELEGGGKWEEVDDIIFTPDGKRIEKVIYAPVISLHRSEEHTSELQSLRHLVCRLLLEKQKITGLRYGGFCGCDDSTMPPSTRTEA